jgi:hypothetical protein
MSLASKSDSARAFTILDAMRDRRLFGKAFKDEATWRAWEAFLAALFGLAMSGEQADRRCHANVSAHPVVG